MNQIIGRYIKLGCPITTPISTVIILTETVVAIFHGLSGKDGQLFLPNKMPLFSFMKLAY